MSTGPMERIQRIKLSTGDARSDAAYYLATLAYHDDRAKFERFCEVVLPAFRPGRAPGRANVRALHDGAKTIYEIRYYASMVAHVVTQPIIAEIARGTAIQVRVADLTISEAQAQLAPRFPKHRAWPNFSTNVWEPSKPVLHMGIAFAMKAINDSRPGSTGLLCQDQRRHPVFT